MAERETKLCAYCGRRFEWRAKWARSWDEVRYCSDACKRRRGRASDRALEDAILRLLGERGPGKSICPSEAARAVGADGWRELMEPARCAARRLAHRDRLRITQGGREVDPAEFRGAIRLRLPSATPRAGGSR